METQQVAGSINYLAVVAAALSGFIVGGLWYAPPLFGGAWLKETGLDPERLHKRNMAVVFGTTFVLSLVGAFVLAMFLGPRPALGFAVGASASVGACWVATSFAINYLFEAKSLKLWAINAGYHTVQYTLMGVVLGLWH